MNQFGDRIRQLRQQKGLLQPQVANQLEMDTPMLSKIERGERNAKREQITIFSKIFSVPQDDCSIARSVSVGFGRCHFVVCTIGKNLQPSP